MNSINQSSHVHIVDITMVTQRNDHHDQHHEHCLHGDQPRKSLANVDIQNGVPGTEPRASVSSAGSIHVISPTRKSLHQEAIPEEVFETRSPSEQVNIALLAL